LIKILDNFYSNVDYVLSLSTDACRKRGCGAGLRSESLETLDKHLYDTFCSAIYSMHGIDGRKVMMTTYFTEHVYNPEKNAGLIHIDGRNPNACDVTLRDYRLILGGQIFLTPTNDLDTGIKFYNVNQSAGWTEEEEFDMTLNKCYTFDKQQLEEYNRNFYEIAEAKNIQNRMVSWTAGIKYRSKMTEKQQNRIIQNFYIST
jgi:hypothetical protein